MIAARPVRIIGGQTGPMLGPIGPTGGLPDFVTGPEGLLGFTGKRGPTGLAGLAGIFTGLIGPTGSKGPAASQGYRGNTGPGGPGELVPDASYQRYLQNTDGYSTFGNFGQYVGCKFRYTTKGLGFTFILFTGLYISTSALFFDVGLFLNTGTAPNAGDVSGAGAGGGAGLAKGNGWIRFKAPGAGYKLPFFMMNMITHVSTGELSGLPSDLWYDLVGAHGADSSSNPAGGVIKNISFLAFEVPTL